MTPQPLPTPRGARVALALAALAPAVALAVAPLPAAKPEDVGMSSKRLARLGEVLTKEIQDGSFRGAVVMVARKGKLVYHGAFGMQTPSAKMSEDSIFRIYSMTKPLATVGAMMLVEDGRLQLTDPVGKWLPGFDTLQVSVASKDGNGQTAYALVPAERPMPDDAEWRHARRDADPEPCHRAPHDVGPPRSVDRDSNAARRAAPRSSAGGAGCVRAQGRGARA
jgi:hypothetical protein